MADVFAPLSSLFFSSRLVGLVFSLPSRGLVGVPGAAAAGGAAREEGRTGGGASAASLVRVTMVEGIVDQISLSVTEAGSFRSHGFRFDVDNKVYGTRQEPGD